MDSRQTIHTRQSQYAPPPPTRHPVVLNMTFEEVVRLSGDLHRLTAALQRAVGNGQIDLPTIQIDD
jgi:hypothetical protein